MRALHLAVADPFDPARFELVKWLAFAAMLCDHVSVFLGDGTGWLRDVGRFAFPVFTLTFGIGLARSRDPLAALRRLILPGLVAELAWRLSGHSPGVNVLLAFGVVGWACVAVRASLGHLPLAGGGGGEGSMVVAALVLVLALGFGIEGGLMTVLLVAGAYAAATWRSVPAFVGLCVLGGALYRLPGVWFAVACLVLAVRSPVPRFRWFAWAYAGHVAALTLLASI